MHTVPQGEELATPIPWSTHEQVTGTSFPSILLPMRVWCQTHESYVMQDIVDEQLGDVVLFAIPFKNSAFHPPGAMLTDFAIYMEGVLRVRAA